MRMITGGVAVALLLFGLDAWIGLGGDAAVTFQLWPFTGSVALPPAAVVVLGVVIGAAAVVTGVILLPRPVPAAPPMTTWDAIRNSLTFVLIAAIAVTAGLLLLVAVRAGKMEAVDAALAYVLGGLAVTATMGAVRRLADGEGVSFDSYWGGLGGAQGGWRVSSAATMLLLALVLIGGTIAVATGRGPRLGSVAGAGKANLARGDPAAGNTQAEADGNKQGAADTVVNNATGNHS